MEKICSKCKIPQPLENFSNSKKSKDGKRSACKPCEKQYREENKERILLQHKQYRDQNKEVIALKYKQWREENKEIIAEKQKQFYENNKEKILSKQKEHNKQNTDNSDKDISPP